MAAGSVSVVVAQDRDRFSREPAYTYLLRRSSRSTAPGYAPSTIGGTRARRES